FAIAKEQRLYFERHQLLELEGILTETQLYQLKENIHQCLSQNKQTIDQLFLARRDLWRKNNVIAKIVKEKDLANIAAELMRAKILRLGYDQYYPCLPLETKAGKLLPTALPSDVANFLDKQATLEEISCIQGVVCGLMICLTSANEEMDS